MPLDLYSTAGKALYDVMAKYKLKILRLNYADQSSNIEALLMDLAAPALQPHINALPGVTDAIGNVRTAQTNFTAKRVAYEKAMALNAEGATASELKKPLLELINARLVPYLKVSKMVSPDTHTHFADAVAQVIATTNTAIRRRSGKNPEEPPAEEQ